MQIMQYIFFCKWEYVVHCGRWWMSGHFLVCLETCSRPSLSDIYKTITDGIYYKTQWLKVTHAIRIVNQSGWCYLLFCHFFFLFHCHLKLWFKQYKIKYKKKKVTKQCTVTDKIYIKVTFLLIFLASNIFILFSGEARAEYYWFMLIFRKPH